MSRELELEEQHGGFSFCVLWSLLWIYGNTNEHRQNYQEKLLCTSKGLTLQHMQRSQHQPSDDPAVWLACSENVSLNIWWSTHPVARSFPQHPLGWWCSQVPPVRPFPMKTLRRFTTRENPSDFSAILWATAVPAESGFQPWGLFMGCCISALKTMHAPCICYCYIIFKFLLLVTNQSVITPKLCYSL